MARPASFGFTGAGGRVGVGEADLHMGAAYTMIRTSNNLTGDPRPKAVLDALER